MDCNPMCQGLPGRGNVTFTRPTLNATYSRQGGAPDATYNRSGGQSGPPAFDATYSVTGESFPSAWNTTYSSSGGESCPCASPYSASGAQRGQSAWSSGQSQSFQMSDLGPVAASTPKSHHSYRSTMGESSFEMSDLGPVAASTPKSHQCYRSTMEESSFEMSDLGPVAASTPKTNRSLMEETIEDIGIINQPDSYIEEVGIVRPNPAEHLDLSHSQMFDASDLEEHGPSEEVSSALARESQISVFDPEELNITMAPSENNFAVRRALFLNSLTHDIDDMEEEESYLFGMALGNYQSALSQELSMRTNITR